MRAKERDSGCKERDGVKEREREREREQDGERLREREREWILPKMSSKITVFSLTPC